MQRFDKNNVQALLTEVVRKRGETYVYGSDPGMWGCHYQRHGAPSCGIGVMLSDIGVPLPVLKDMDNCGDADIESPQVKALLKNAGFTFTDGALKFMLAFQRWQDQSKSYGRCLEMAKAGNTEPYGSDSINSPF